MGDSNQEGFQQVCMANAPSTQVSVLIMPMSSSARSESSVYIHSRSWDKLYAVMGGNLMGFYKDQKHSKAVSCCPFWGRKKTEDHMQ